MKQLLRTDVSKFTSTHAKMILYKFMTTVSQELMDDWTPMDTVIGKAGDTITPANLFKIVTVETPFHGQISSEIINEESIVGALLLIYRLNQLPNYATTTDIVGQISGRFQNVFGTPPPFSFQSAVQHLRFWDSDLEYRKLIAGFDLFFDKFPLHKYAQLRFGTLSSAWRDCTALKTVFKVYYSLGMTELAQLGPWLWEPNIQADAWHLFAKPLNLNSDNLGYFLYMADMGFVTRSIYSVTMNQAIHIFCQTIYCVFGIPRGLNARMVYPNQIQATIRNALAVAYVYNVSDDWDINIIPEKEKNQYLNLKNKIKAAMEDDNKDSDTEDGNSQEPVSRDPNSIDNPKTGY